MTYQIFIQQLINGISLGSLYGLIAIGYTMVYGILRLINFAHGDVMMMSCYFAFFGILVFSLPWWLSFIIAIALTGLLGMLIDKGAYKPVRKAPRISALITAIGVSFLLENLALVIWGGRPKAFYQPKFFSKKIVIAGVHLVSLSIWIPLITALLLIIVMWILYRTKTGMAMRSISRDMETTALMGINVDSIISKTFILGSVLAGAGGMMWAMKYPQVNPFIGIIPGLKAFVAAVLGGIGNVPGAVLGGFLLGITEIMLVALLPDLAGYRDAFAFIILIGILIFRPTGILGEVLPE
ncbi:MAG: branched-chain amino acid ABC transporter permease [Spirochaetes bacterium]|nr:MAG: branched-chain amino acid ABC transporter permease [Spirochaetota bacterium]RLA90435.1 MAG: branched-chain amino acid ABC transporter permease [Deltaproteobacteria bacterium]